MSIAVPLYGFGASGGSPNKSTIIVTAPTGSTVTCTMGSITKTAPEKNGVWTFGGLDLGTWTITSTKGGDSATQDVAITRLTVEYVTIVYRITPEFTYTGDYEIVDDSDNAISDFVNWKSNWKIRFLTSGTLTFTNLNGWDGKLDVFLVGGGGAGGQGWNSAGAGGGGGYTKTVKAVTVTANVAYPIVVGAGGTVTSTAKSGDGGTTSAFGSSASGGSGGGGINQDSVAWVGGNGGSGGADYPHRYGGTDGSNASSGGTGQGTTTKEFGASDGKLYSGGGSSGTNIYGGETTIGAVDETAGAPGITPPANRGGGGGGSNHSSYNNATAGGSGIVIIRNKR